VLFRDWSFARQSAGSPSLLTMVRPVSFRRVFCGRANEDVISLIVKTASSGDMPGMRRVIRSCRSDETVCATDIVHPCRVFPGKCRNSGSRLKGGFSQDWLPHKACLTELVPSRLSDILVVAEESVMSIGEFAPKAQTTLSGSVGRGAALRELRQAGQGVRLTSRYFFRPAPAFFWMRRRHAVRRAPASSSSLVAARRM
jgi:hypothetical protein